MQAVRISLFILVFTVAGAAAQSAPSVYVLHMLEGQDTVSTERVTRTGDRLDVDMLVQQQGVRFVFTVELIGDAGVRRVTNRFFREPSDAEPAQVVVVAFEGDSASVNISGNVSRTMMVAAPPGALPWIFPSNALIEQALLRSRALGGETDVPFFNVANGQSTTAELEWEGSSTATVRFAEAVMTAELGADGLLDEIRFRGGQRRVVRTAAP